MTSNKKTTRGKRKGAKYRTIPAHTRNGTRVSSYKRRKRHDLRDYRTVRKS